MFIKLLLNIKPVDLNNTERNKIIIGRPWHYGHFIHDVVLPFSHIYLKYLEDGKKITNTILSDDERQTIGTFEKHFNNLFELSHREVTVREFTTKKFPIIKLNTYLMGPYPNQYAIPLKRYIYNKFLLNSTPPQNIYIIKRGVSKLRFEKKIGDIRIYKNGKQRLSRKIKNIQPMIKLIRHKYKIKEIVLDNMTMHQQLKLFANCKCLIGVHGAGMTNAIWLQDNSLVIEIRSNRHPKSIERLSKATNCKYERLILNNNKIDINNIINILDTHFKK